MMINGKFSSITDFIQSIEDIVNSDLGKVFLIPFIYGAAGLCIYLIKKRLEKNRIAEYNQLADLHKKLNDNETSIKALDHLRDTIEKKGEKSVIGLAWQYAEHAKIYIKLAKELMNRCSKDGYLHKKIDNDPFSMAWNNAATQTDMNLLSSEKAEEIDHELTSLILYLLKCFSNDDANMLKKSQDIWLSFRQIEVDREAEQWNGGTICPLMANIKYEVITRERLVALREETKYPDGTKLEPCWIRTPSDILKYFKRGISKDSIYKLVGKPDYIIENTWFYRFSENQVELTFDNDEKLINGWMALCNEKFYSGYCPISNIPFGELSIGDILKLNPNILINHSCGPRMERIYVQVPCNGTKNYFFGAIHIRNGGEDEYLKSVNFEWDYKLNRLITDPHSILTTWVGMLTPWGSPHSGWICR